MAMPDTETVVRRSTPSADRPSARFATRCAFLAAGFGLASWAPLVPYAKSRLGIDDGVLGLLLLCLGIGSIVAMPLTGALSARFGGKWIIVISGFGVALFLPFLAIASTPLWLGAALLMFGASLGSLDVAMNVHAVEVERDSDRLLMSGFHALFSIGGFAGSGLSTLLLSAHFGIVAMSVCCAALIAVMTAAAWPFLLSRRAAQQTPFLVRPHGIVLWLAALAGIMFLVEGALLDWGALIFIDADLVAPAQGGIGYMGFAIAMTFARLTGDRLTAALGGRTVFVWGGILSVAGVAVILLAPTIAIALAGFVLTGIGAANIVPILFRRAGTQTAMPAGLAVAAITTVGYASILVGPAGIGFVSHGLGLHAAFWLVAALLAVVPLCARFVVAD